MAFEPCVADKYDLCVLENGCCMTAKSVTQATDDEVADLGTEDEYKELTKSLEDLGFELEVGKEVVLCVDEASKKTWVDDSEGKYKEPSTMITFETSCYSGASKVVAATLAAAGAVLATF